MVECAVAAAMNNTGQELILALYFYIPQADVVV